MESPKVEQGSFENLHKEVQSKSDNVNDKPADDTLPAKDDAENEKRSVNESSDCIVVGDNLDTHDNKDGQEQQQLDSKRLPAKRKFEEMMKDSFRWHSNDVDLQPFDVVDIGGSDISFFRGFLDENQLCDLRDAFKRFSRSGGCIVFYEPNRGDDQKDQELRPDRRYFRKEFVVKPAASTFLLKLKVSGEWQTASAMSATLSETQDVLRAAEFIVQHVAGQGKTVMGVQRTVVKSPKLFPHTLTMDRYKKCGWSAIVVPVNGKLWPWVRETPVERQDENMQGHRQPKKVAKNDHKLETSVERGGALLLRKTFLNFHDLGAYKWDVASEKRTALIYLTVFFRDNIHQPTVTRVESTLVDDGFDDDEDF